VWIRSLAVGGNSSCPPAVGYDQFGEEIARKIGIGSLGSVTRHRSVQEEINVPDSIRKEQGGPARRF